MLPVKQFNEFIAQKQLFNKHHRLLAAVSGGMDSVVMVHLLKAAGFDFGIAHCNFQLRGDESTRDEEFCNSLAQQLEVPFHSTKFDTLADAAEKKVSVQMAARQLRYQWFEQVRQQSGYTVIALAHHQNDAIETILLNLTRGTGIAGLHGILPKNNLLIRPLLFLKREEIAAIAAENEIAYVEDSSNVSSKYARNKIRLEVIPKLKELNPALEQTFESNLAHFRELEVLLTQKVSELKEELFSYNGDEIRLPVAALKELSPQRLLLFSLLQQFGVNDTIINDLILALYKHSGRVFETAGHRLLVDRDQLIITPGHVEVVQAIQINVNDNSINFGGYKLRVLHDDSPLMIKDNPMALSVDGDLLIYPLSMRTWQEGDRFYPLGMKGTKKLSDFFIGQKVPLHQKTSIPLLVNGNGDIIWIGGHRPDDRYKVTAKTKKVIIFELIRF